MQEILAAALSDTKVKHTIVKMNPKAITLSQMYGSGNGREWADGIFSALWRRSNNNNNNNNNNASNIWIVLDGPVDAIWSENLNLVMDDSKALTLPSNERIHMSPNVKLLFETENLRVASPATVTISFTGHELFSIAYAAQVSRVGIVYMSESDLGWKPILRAWLAGRCQADFKPMIQAISEKYIDGVFVHMAVQDLFSRKFVLASHTMPCCAIPYHTIPYHTIPDQTIPYHTIPCHTTGHW